MIFLLIFFVLITLHTLTTREATSNETGYAYIFQDAKKIGAYLFHE